jgi:hypothetical protein
MNVEHAIPCGANISVGLKNESSPSFVFEGLDIIIREQEGSFGRSLVLIYSAET